MNRNENMAAVGAVRSRWRGDAVCDQSTLAFEYYKSYQSYIEAITGKRSDSTRKDLGFKSQADSEVLLVEEKLDRIVPPVWCGYSTGTCRQLRSSSAAVRGAICDVRVDGSREFSGEFCSVEESARTNRGCHAQSTLEHISSSDSGELLCQQCGAGGDAEVHEVGHSEVRQEPACGLLPRASDNCTNGLNGDTVSAGCENTFATSFTNSADGHVKGHVHSVVSSVESSDVVTSEARIVKGQPGFWKQQRNDKKMRRKLIEKTEKKEKKKNNVRVEAIKEKKNWRDFGAESDVSAHADSELKASLRRKWLAQNELAAMRAERAVEIAKQMELSDQVKRATTRLKLETEKNMVGIEKTHATLRATGNIPGVIGSVETILDATISPDSSASMKEFREVQKKNLDLEEKIRKLEKRFGVTSDDIDFCDKETYTDTSENHRKLAELIKGDFGIVPVGEENGKSYFKVHMFSDEIY